MDNKAFLQTYKIILSSNGALRENFLGIRFTKQGMTRLCALAYLRQFHVAGTLNGSAGSAKGKDYRNFALPKKCIGDIIYQHLTNQLNSKILKRILKGQYK